MNNLKKKSPRFKDQILFEDNHILVVNKLPKQIVQGDKTGDKSLAELAKDCIKEKYNKPGEVYLGIVHRLDRPTSGIVVFARTSKAAARLSKMFHDHEVKKTYWALVKKRPEMPSGTLVHYLKKNEEKNRSSAKLKPANGYKEAILDYELKLHSDKYNLLEIKLKTGRHHQIRCQLAAIGSTIKGDLKYGAPRSNPDGSISLHSRHISCIFYTFEYLSIVCAGNPCG